ncbi:MAG: effector binding domain-containing protein [Bacteroidota bacterium]
MMVEEKPRLARLTAILTQLQSRRILTASELARKHRVSVRTIYRDIRTLEKSGVPIITEEGKGYSLMEGYSLPPIMFTEAEANALLMAEQLILTNKDQSLVDQYQQAITKIKSVLNHGQQEKTAFLSERIQIRNNSKDIKTSDYLIQLQSAIANFFVVRITYIAPEQGESQRKIEPFALYTTQDNWILVAYCRLRQDFRAFRLDRIQSLFTSSESFTPHSLTLAEYMEQCRENWKNTPDIQLSLAEDTFALNQQSQDMQEVQIEPFHLIGIAVRTTNQDGQAAKDIGTLWAKFQADKVAEHIPHKSSPEIYSLYTDYEGDHTQPYSVVLGCKVDKLEKIPEGMIAKSFEGGKYLKTSAKGDLMKGVVVNKWMEIWNSELDRSFTADFEVYGEKALNPADAEVDFFIAVH